jgi:hypothetical protein
MEESNVTYGTLAEFVFGSNVPATSPKILDLLIAHVCELHQKSQKNVSKSDLQRLRQTLSSFCSIFRKKYKAEAYNQNRLRKLDWFNISFNFHFTNSQDDCPATMSHEEPGDLNGDNRLSVPRRELFDRMRESNTSITDTQGQTELLFSHLKSSFNFECTEDQLLLLQKDLRFFVLEIRKRFIQKPISQNYEKFIKKYSTSFLSKKFLLPIDGNFADDGSNNFDSNESQKSEALKLRLGIGRIPPTEFQPLKKDGNVALTNQLKSERRLGLSKLEKNVPSLHHLK